MTMAFQAEMFAPLKDTAVARIFLNVSDHAHCRT
jgi:hypothetical protein